MININRLRSRMLEMANIGRTEKDGVTRLALTEIDKQARNLFIQWMDNIGLKVRYDDFGNIYGRLEGIDINAPAIMSGSHLDSVPMGGRFDGTLGVLAALEVIETMLEKDIKTYHPIEIVSFTNEEGVRFSPQMLGSGAVTGEFTHKYVYSRKDAAGVSYEDALRKIGFIGSKENRTSNVKSFIELHIEQGPILEATQQTVGIINGISGFIWMEVTINGETNHSGTTPMNYRKDSLVIVSKIIEQIHLWAKEKSPEILATVGKIETQPGVINAVPGQTTFTLDVRCSATDVFQSILEEIKELIMKQVDNNLFTCSINEIKTHAPVHFSKKLVEMLEGVCKKQDIDYRVMQSGAGHDSMYMNNIADTAMLFVPSINGKSHCEDEFSNWEDIEMGVSILCEAIINLANEKS